MVASILSAECPKLGGSFDDDDKDNICGQDMDESVSMVVSRRCCWMTRGVIGYDSIVRHIAERNSDRDSSLGCC